MRLIGFKFQGLADVGEGAAILKDGSIQGGDSAGVKFDGTYTESDGAIAVAAGLSTDVPIELVTGRILPAGTPTAIEPFTISAQAPQTAATLNIMGLGTVTVDFAWLRDITL